MGRSSVDNPLGPFFIESIVVGLRNSSRFLRTPYLDFRSTGS